MEKHKWRFSRPLIILILISFLLLFLFLTAFFINWEVGLKSRNRYLILEDNPQVNYLLVFKQCGHQVDCPLEVLPADFSSINYSGLTREDLMMKLPVEWGVLNFTSSHVVLGKIEDKLCYDCQGSKYIGIYEDRIAIYQGIYPHGVLIEITDFEVKEVYCQELERGIPFTTKEQKRKILESYTS